MYDLASKYHQNGILSDETVVETVVRMDDKSLFMKLSMVKGIDSWYVYMFMILSLHIPDVLPISLRGEERDYELFAFAEFL